MIKKLRIAVADDEPDMQQYFRKMLPRFGHDVVSVAENGWQLVEQVCQQQPDLVITDIKMPELDGIQAAKAMYRDRPIPVILVSACHDPELIERAEADHVMAYLVKPIKQTDLEPAIVVVMGRFRQFQVVRKEAADARQALEDRKLIERAKGILMKRAVLDEPAAFQRLQKLASEKQQKLVRLAHAIVTADAACV